MAANDTGDKQAAAEMAERFVSELAPLGDGTKRAMFGGYGVFESGVMFALIDRAGTPHRRADESNEPRYVDAGGTKHGMPYWMISTAVLGDPDESLTWAAEALEVARSSKRR